MIAASGGDDYNSLDLPRRGGYGSNQGGGCEEGYGYGYSYGFGGNSTGTGNGYGSSDDGHGPLVAVIA